MNLLILYNLEAWKNTFFSKEAKKAETSFNGVVGRSRIHIKLLPSGAAMSTEVRRDNK